jgi:plasmid stabilization system protein ParE
VRLLADFPETGPAADEVRAGCRIVVISGYRVLYEYDASADTVTVMTIVEPYRELKGLV